MFYNQKLIKFILSGVMYAIFIYLSSCQSPHECPDLILYNGKFVTLDSVSSIQGAMTVKDEKVLALAKDLDDLGVVCEHTKVIDLKGHTVVPGLI